MDIQDNVDIVFSTEYSLNKTNTDGNIKWSIPQNDLSALKITLNENIAVSKSPNQIMLFDSNGNYLREFSFRGYARLITQLTDNYFLVGGESEEKGWVLKTDPEFSYAALEVLKPDGTEVLDIFKGNYSVQWFSHNVDKINAQLSTDNGMSWILIEEAIDSEITDSVSFQFDESFTSDNCYVKISETGGTNCDENDYPFSIGKSNPTDYYAGNEIVMWIGNSGMGSHNPVSHNSGLYWPGGWEAVVNNQAVPAVFADGLVWGGK